MKPHCVVTMIRYTTQLALLRQLKCDVQWTVWQVLSNPFKCVIIQLILYYLFGCFGCFFGLFVCFYFTHCVIQFFTSSLALSRICHRDCHITELIAKHLKAAPHTAIKSPSRVFFCCFF